MTGLVAPSAPQGKMLAIKEAVPAVAPTGRINPGLTLLLLTNCQAFVMRLQHGEIAAATSALAT